jgi:hypothetical protein
MCASLISFSIAYCCVDLITIATSLKTKKLKHEIMKAPAAHPLNGNGPKTNAADSMPQKLITATSAPESPGLNRMKLIIRSCHSKLSKAQMSKVLHMYMSNLGIAYVLGTIPSWWPPKVTCKYHTELSKEGKHSHKSFLSH